MDEQDTVMGKVLGFAEAHPYMLLGACVVLVIMLLLTFASCRGWIGGSKNKKKSRDILEDDDDEMNDLIKSIHMKQKRNRC